MNEEDLALARVLVSESESPGGSPAPLRKTPITQMKDRSQAFRYVFIKICFFFLCHEIDKSCF